MANYLSNLPIELVELIYEKKHRAEMKDILNTIRDQRKCYRGHYGCVKCTHEVSKKMYIHERDVGHKWALYKDGIFMGDYTLQKILKNTYRFVDRKGNKKNIGRETMCWTYEPSMRKEIMFERLIVNFWNSEYSFTDSD